MNSRNESKLNMYRTVKQICDDNATTVATNVAFLAAFNSFKAKLSSLITSVTAESQVIRGIAVDKNVLRKNLCQSATDISAIIFAYASNINNNTLKQSVNFSFSDFYKTKDELIAPTAQNIHTIATTNATALVPYGISPAMLTSFQTAITDYSASVPKPRTALSVKATFTKNIRVLINDIDLVLKDQMDKIIPAFKPSKPDFYNSFKSARIIIDPSKTTTQLKGNITDITTDLPIKNAKIELSGSQIIDINTTKSGRYIQKPIANGLYNMTVSAEGFKTKIISDYKVILGQVNRLDIQLETE